MPTPLAKKMYDLFTALGVTLPCDAAAVTIYRIRPGFWQRGAGAWSWHLYAPLFDAYVNGRLTNYGSQYSATELAAARYVSLSHEGDALLVEWGPCEHMKLDPSLRFCKQHRIYDAKGK